MNISQGMVNNMKVTKISSVCAQGGSHLFCDFDSYDQNHTLRKSKHIFNPAIVAAIVKRQPKNICRLLDARQRFYNKANASRESLFPSQYEALEAYYGKLLNDPVKLAIKICSIDGTETTQDSDATRFDVLYCLAANWNALIEDAKRKGYAIPNLQKTLEYANSFKDKTALDIFINGLSDENKARVAEILKRDTQQAPYGCFLYPSL